jgi:hypothetical protein
MKPKIVHRIPTNKKGSNPQGGEEALRETTRERERSYDQDKENMRKGGVLLKLLQE